MEGDAGLQEGIAATIEAALTDHDEGLRAMAELNVHHGELKYDHESLQWPPNAERSVHVGPELERVFGQPDVAITISDSKAGAVFSDLEMGSVYSNQTVSGTADLTISVADRLGVHAREDIHAEAAEATVRHLPGGVMIGAPSFEQ